MVETNTARETTQMSGTLLELAVATGGDEDAMFLALENGYTLTGNFKGHEAEMVQEAA